MKIAIWVVFAFVVLLWTGGAALLVQLVEWSAQRLAAGDATAIGTVVATAHPPAWLGSWIDATSWAGAQEAVGSAISSFPGVLPAVSDAFAWLVPAVWVIWGLGLLALVALALLATAFLGRIRRGFDSGQQAA